MTNIVLPAGYSSNEIITKYAESGRQFQIDDLYRYVLFVMALQAFYTLLNGFIQAGGDRRRMFTEEFLKEKFGEEHEREVGGEIARGGFPDVGDGRYTMACEYKDWYSFNKNQRVHQNLLEAIGPVLVSEAIIGLKYPLVPIIAGSLYIVFRLAFGCLYSRNVNKRALAFPFLFFYQIGILHSSSKR